MKLLQFLIIHCTATIGGQEVSSDTIRKWHLSPKSKGGRGWKQVGYSDMIHLTGEVENLVPYDDDEYKEPWEITNGVAGINSSAHHVVYVGGLNVLGKPEDTRTDDQNISLQRYVKAMLAKHPNILIAGHNQFANKACPCFDVPKWLTSLGFSDKNIYHQPKK